MKTILVDAVDTFVIKTETQELAIFLEQTA